MSSLLDSYDNYLAKYGSFENAKKQHADALQGYEQAYANYIPICMKLSKLHAVTNIPAFKTLTPEQKQLTYDIIKKTQDNEVSTRASLQTLQNTLHELEVDVLNMQQLKRILDDMN